MKTLNEKQVKILIKSWRDTAKEPRKSGHGIGVASGMNITADLLEEFFKENATE